MKAIKAEENISGAELLEAILRSMPMSSHAGTNIVAPPIPKQPPTKPAMNPKINAFFINFYDILSSSF